jgi:hypothetical protein
MLIQSGFSPKLLKRSAQLAVATMLFLTGSRSAGAASVDQGYYVGQCSDGRAIYFATPKKKEQPLVVHLQGLPEEELYLKTNSPAGFEYCVWSEEPKCQVLGLLIKPAPSRGQVNGYVSVRSATNAAPFTARKVASQASFSNRRGVHVLQRGGSKEFTATWPEFQSRAAFPQFVSQLLAAEARGETSQFLAGAHEIAWDGLKTGGASYDWEGSLDTDLVWLGTNVMSLSQLRAEYTGGAHGNYGLSGRNFFLREGKVKEFQLADLFRPDSGWEAALSKLCVRDLRRQHASWLTDDAPKEMKITSFKAADMASFTVDVYGLRIHFDPYAVGPYAEGMFHVVIPWADLKEYLAPAVPASLLHP